MSYRKVFVNNIEYEYTIGRTHTKIKDVGVFLNQDIGDQYDILCHCGCGVSMNTLSGNTQNTKTGVTPSKVVAVIRNKIGNSDV